MTTSAPRRTRTTVTACGIFIGLVLVAYPVMLAPGRGAPLWPAAAAGIALAGAAAAPQHAFATVAAAFLILEYATALYVAGEGIDVAAPFYGLLLVLLHEAFDLAAEARAGTAVGRGLSARRVAFIVAGAGVGTLAGVGVQLVRGATGAGGLLALAMAAACGALALALPVGLLSRTARSEPGGVTRPS
jgi:hypothetical protein